MTPQFHVTLDCDIKENPAKRVQLTVEGLPRNEAILFAEDFLQKTGFKYNVVFVIQGFKYDFK